MPKYCITMQRSATCFLSGFGLLLIYLPHSVCTFAEFAALRTKVTEWLVRGGHTSMKKRQRNPRAESVTEAEGSPFSVVEVEGSVYFQCNICQQKVLLDEESSEV